VTLSVRQSACWRRIRRCLRAASNFRWGASPARRQPACSRRTHSASRRNPSAASPVHALSSVTVPGRTVARASTTRGTRGRKSSIRLLPAISTITAIAKADTFCWCERFRAGQENIKLSGRQSQKLAVGLARPSHLRSGSDVVTGEFAFQAPGKTLVKQDAHGRGAPPWPAPRLPRPAPW
jgi:hypothetical protein